MIVSDHDCTVLDDASETIAEIASKVSFRGAIYRFFCPRFVCSGVQVQNRHQHKSLVLCCVETVNFRVGFRRNLRIFFRRLIHLFSSFSRITYIKLFIIVAETFADIIRLEKPYCAKIPKFSWLVSALCTGTVLRIEKGLGL
ncbi:unnamed protein product [Rhizophagus irregularis]|nr:unnamed protein product [Rhizophagus irregularis]